MYTESTPKPSTIRPMIAVVILNLALLVVVGYSFHDRDQANAQAKRLASQNDHALTALAQTRGQVDNLNAKISELEAAEQALQAAAAAAAAQKPQETKAAESKPTAARLRRDDPRWKEVQAALQDQGLAIDMTRQDLDAARVEFGDSIARTHSELVALEKQGERNFYEFDIVQGKKFERQGPISVRLKKASMKHSFADLELMVDDNKLTQKHVNLNQPVLFYVNGSDQPVEVVLNDVKFNSVHGYVSEPKYKATELTTDAPVEDGSSARQQLQIRTQE